MSYYGQYNNYRTNARRNSNSFSEEETVPKRTKWNRRGGNIGGRPRNVETVSPQPLFKEPILTPRRSPAQNRNRDTFSRNGPNATRTQHHFDMKDMPNFVEPEHLGKTWNVDKFTQDCKSWQDRHKLAYYRSRCMALEFENQMLFDQVSSLVEENCIFAAERGEMPTMRLPELHGRREQSEEGESRFNKKSTKNQNQGKNKASSESSSDIECEFDEDALDYLEKTIRHRLTLKKKRKEVAEKNKGTAETLKKEELKKQEEGPKHPVGIKRKEDLDVIYGGNSSLIQKLETATQLNFNRNCDTFKPEMWMAVPLNPNTVVA